MAEGDSRPRNVHDVLCLTCVAIFQPWLFINIYILFSLLFSCNTGLSIFEDEEGRKSLESRKNPNGSDG